MRLKQPLMFAMHTSIINTAQKYIKEPILSVEKLEGGSNNVFKLSAEEKSYVFKEYLNRGTHADSEPLLYDLLKHPKFFRKQIALDFSQTHYPEKFSIYEYIEGDRLFDLVRGNKLETDQIDLIVQQVILLIQEFAKIKPEGFGKIDLSSARHDLSDNWKDFLTDYHQQTSLKTKVLNEDLYRISQLTSSFIPKILRDKEFQPVLIPCDLNTKNILISKDNELVLLSGAIMSADEDYGFVQFLSHTYKTQLGDSMIAQLSLSAQRLAKFHLYCMISNINVLSFIYEHTSIDGLESCPWGNYNTFSKLLLEHQRQIVETIGVNTD